MSFPELPPNSLYVVLGLAVCFGPPLVKRLLRKRRQKGYRAALEQVLKFGEKTKSVRIYVERTASGELLLRYSDWNDIYDRILADSETVNDAVLQLEAAGFTVEDGPG